jgi:hypothetical protein
MNKRHLALLLLEFCSINLAHPRILSTFRFDAGNQISKIFPQVFVQSKIKRIFAARINRRNPAK